MAEKLKATGAKERKGNAPKQTRIEGTEMKDVVGAVPTAKFDRIVKDIADCREAQSEANAANMSAYKRFEEAGGNNKALKTSLQMAKMSDDKRFDYWRSLTAYVDRMELLKGPMDMFAQDPVAKAQDAKPLDALKSKEDSKEEQGAYEAGIASCKFGRDRESNPHDKTKKAKEYAAFDKGWVAAFEGGHKGSMKQGGGEDGGENSGDQSNAPSNVTTLQAKPNGGDAKPAATDSKA